MIFITMALLLLLGNNNNDRVDSFQINSAIAPDELTDKNDSGDYTLLGPIVYGEDNRIEIYQIDNSRIINLAMATAAFIPAKFLKRDGDLISIVGADTLQEKINRYHYPAKLCSQERFKDQPVASVCTGFLVDRDILITAGHCINDDYFNCSNSYWVFGHAYVKNVNGKLSDPLNIPADDIYRCFIVERKFNVDGDDYAILKLDRPVTDRQPLKIRRSGQVDNHNKLYIIGHPSGLPSKYAGNAIIRDNSDPKFFTSNLDGFSGNSGSPVFNKNTHIVEGLLLRGGHDYTYDEQNQCIEVNKDNNDNGQEEIYRITNIVFVGD
jgi:V8-like Glu-specific endopeptidase